MPKRQKVFIIDHVPDLCSLFDMLLSEAGYSTASAVMAPRVMEQIRQFHPTVILLDLLPGHADDLDLLDQFRTDPATRGTPVVAMSTIPDMLAQAVASYNVQQILVKPFDVEDLAEKTRAALEGSPLLAILEAPPRPTNPLFGEVAQGLAAVSRAMVIRWVQRVAATEPFRGKKLDLAEVIDKLPVLLQAVLVALQTDDFRAKIAQDPTIRETVVEHVRLRRSQRIPLADIVREYQFLREEIRCEIAGILQGKNPTAEETLEIVTRKDYALDTIIRLTINAYEQEEGK